MRWFVRLVIGGVMVSVVWTAYNLWDVWSSARHDQRENVDAIVVLGAAQYNGRPSPVLRARLDHAIDLWNDELADTVVVTGGRTTGDTSTEAGVSAAYLARNGIPDENVLREVQGRSTWESLRAASNFMQERGIEKVVLVSDPFHNARIEQMAGDLGLDPVVSPTDRSQVRGGELAWHYAKETVALSVGRVVGFNRLWAFENDITQPRE